MVAKKGVHGGGQIPGLLGSNYSNVDTAYRGVPPELLNGTSLINQSHMPIWLPLITGTSALVDNGVDFLGIPVSTNLSTLSTRSCTHSGTAPITSEVINDVVVRTAHFPASVCKASGSFVGFGIAVYGDHAPVNFESDLAPLWEPAPVAEKAVAEAVTAVLAALAPSVPNPLTVLTYSLGLAGVATGIQGQVLGLTDDLPVPVPDTGDPTGSLPELPELPELPIPTLP